MWLFWVGLKTIILYLFLCIFFACFQLPFWLSLTLTGDSDFSRIFCHALKNYWRIFKSYLVPQGESPSFLTSPNFSGLVSHQSLHMLKCLTTSQPPYTCPTAGSQHGRSHPWQGHAEETWQARRIRTRGTPWTCSSIYPKPKSVCLLFTMLCLSPTLLALTGGYPWPPFLEKINLGL